MKNGFYKIGAVVTALAFLGSMMFLPMSGAVNVNKNLEVIDNNKTPLITTDDDTGPLFC